MASGAWKQVAATMVEFLLHSFSGSFFAGTSLNQGLCEPVCLIAAVQPSFAEHGELFARMVK